MALSRTPHALLDMATPALSALMWEGGFPSASVVILGIITAFSGYTAVYALNDLVDLKSDRERLSSGPQGDRRSDVDALFVRHPMAKGLLPLEYGAFWILGWSTIALLGAFSLRPLCALVFLVACFLEVIYCRLFQVSPLRAIVSGCVKSSGAVAAVFAVDPEPSPLFLLHIFVWLCLWEIGGQNIPNDWADLEEDTKLRGKTIPRALGRKPTAILTLSCLILATMLGSFLPLTSKAQIEVAYFPASLVSAFVLLLIPAVKLAREKTPVAAAILFNRASYYPLAILLSLLIAL